MPARLALSAPLVLLVAVASAAAGSAGPHTERVSVSSSGAQADRESRGPSISHTGRFVAFASWGRNLVSGDKNGVIDVFVHDRQTGTTNRVSVASSGREGNHRSNWPSISSDGRFLAFESRASNLAPGDRDHGWDVFVRDLKRNTTRLVSIQSRGRHGGAAPSISADGRSVAFEGFTPAGPTGDIYVRNLRTNKTERVTHTSTQRYQPSITPSLSGDGRLVVFTRNSQFKTPIPRSGTDVFVRDLRTHKTEKVSVGPHPRQSAGYSASPRISADGRYVAFVSYIDIVTGDTNGQAGVFRRDLKTGKTERVSVSSNGEVGDNGGFNTAISANGRFVAFDSYATNLVPDDTNGAEDVFVRDVASGTTTRVSVSDSGEQGESASGQSYEKSSSNPAISADGRFAAFQSRAFNLVPGDTNDTVDVFVRGPLRP